MSTPCISGQVSKDFPLYHNDRIPVYVSQYNFQHPKNYSKLRMTYSNEHPDIFRIKGMREGGYINPYLNNIDKVDREEYLKKIENSKNKIKLIDFIKSSRKFSQDPKYLNLIKNEQYTRRKKIEESTQNTEKNYNSLSIDNKRIFNKALNSLNQNISKLAKNYTKKNLDLSKVKRIGDNYLINKSEINKVKNISCAFDIKRSSYIANYNDYKISDAQKKDPDKEFNYPRKPIIKLNPINNKNQTLYPPPYKFPRWGTFSENYFILSNTNKGFNRKGGLFTELVNKNIDKIKVLKDDEKERLKQKKEIEKTQREKLFQDTGYKFNNFDMTQLNQNYLKYNSLTPSSSMNNILLGKKFKEMFSDKSKNITHRNNNNNNILKFIKSYNDELQL